ncbi:recombinase family protein [Dyadobacter sp. NIV53]|uniref:recombinase family protein n=1 Tax=Dyadobacter sp. NIV53 TaxID=2861765 RepID=UPI001C8755E2|nr:recombinase family protein [Dyadobacter sp. NIV53]
MILLPIGKVYSGIAGKTHRRITGKLFRNTGKACSDFLVKYEIGIVVNYRVEYAVWRIDRLCRTTYELVKLMVEWKEMGVDFRSISEGIDTSTKMGRLWDMLSSVFAENEREILMERTLAGMEAARARGMVGGQAERLNQKIYKQSDM